MVSKLDGERKARVVQFLYESGLISIRRRVLVLQGADLTETSLSHADLRGASLSWTRLTKADLSYAKLISADLSFAIVPIAKLYSADLREADLTGSSLSFAYLREADLSGADLSYAKLIGALGWTDDQLRTAKSLEGTTMPNGQILKGGNDPDMPTFEEWLKDTEPRKEDRQNY